MKHFAQSKNRDTQITPCPKESKSSNKKETVENRKKIRKHSAQMSFLVVTNAHRGKKDDGGEERTPAKYAFAESYFPISPPNPALQSAPSIG